MSDKLLGTVQSIDETKGINLLIDGETEPTLKKYLYLGSYVPQTDDRVLIEEISGTYVIMGKIISDFSESGISKKAETSQNSENATKLNGKTENQLSVLKSTNSDKLNSKLETELAVKNAGKVRSGGGTTGAEITFTHSYGQIVVLCNGNSFTLKGT